jgi:putative heme-binding domain-containing protein
VTEGLVLWLDAARQGEARQANKQSSIASGNQIGVWFDGSGLSHHLVQRIGSAQPMLFFASDDAAVRFDGQDDHLMRTGPAESLEAFTAFVVAAPRANPGGFVGFLAANATGLRDYDSGFNLDMGPLPTPRFETVNAEGKGFGGAVDLMNEALAFGTFHTIEVRCQPRKNGVELAIDGQAQGRRNRDAGPLRIDEITVGARFYTNEVAPAYTRGFLDGDIAEVLLFGRALSDLECRKVREYLAHKHTGLDRAIAQATRALGVPLQRVANPPAVQMLVPGFVVERLPVKLKNINNIRYRHDGKLVALAYGGDVWLLSDRDRDGLEDHAETFWDKGRLQAPIGMALTPPNYKHGQGLFVAAKGKCSLVVDTDLDDRADREIVVAEGWEELPHGVDALGVAVAGDGSVYFGLGAGDYTNPYRVDQAGKPQYTLKSERGTIERVAADFKSREIIATGIRFPVALAFNKRGDLFATDQEGATWLPNGNPFDELLHIQAGRHYGFPPRHSKFLPSVVDEPSVFDYAPQHQSTCGLVFNEPVSGGPAFGPDAWHGDAIVCGYSRGKIYRTSLLATPAGYVARTMLLARLNMLTVDACVAPDGSLVVAAHSGGPDWGSGPEGEGALYKIRYANGSLAQPVLAWPQSPREVRVAFDRPIDPEHLRGLTGRIGLAGGKYVDAGDRFESLRPGYAVVAAQTAAPRFEPPVRGIEVTPDRRTLILAVDPQTEVSTYALTLPGFVRSPSGADPRGLPQEPAVDLAYNLTGVQAVWQSAKSTESWSGWLPHLDPLVSRTFTAGSAEHDRLWPMLEERGSLHLTAQLDLRNMLRPAVQPGSRVDDVLPPEVVSLSFESSGPIHVRAPGAEVKAGENGSSHVAELTWRKLEDRLYTIEVELTTGGSQPRLDVAWHTAEDSRPRALPLRRLLLPWARAEGEPSAELAAVQPELAGGNWLRGRQVFSSSEAKCSQCHMVRGEGQRIGPDLSNLVHRDYASVLRDIREPSFAINPDYITYVLALADGRVLSGPIRTEGERLLVGDAEGRVVSVNRSDVEELKPAAISTMPEKLAETLGPVQMRDLLTFLLSPGLEPAPIHRQDAPPPRSAAEVEAVFQAAPGGSRVSTRPLRIVLVAGPKDHGIDEHDYPLWQERWAQLLSLAEGVTVTRASVWPSDEEFAKADVVIWFSANPGWSAAKGRQLDAYLARGGGMVYLHYAVNGRDAPEALAERIGLAWRDGASRFRHGPLELLFAEPDKHPISAGFSRISLIDESYWNLTGNVSRVEVLASADEQGQARPLFWVHKQSKGRVFCSIPGHYNWTFDDPLFRILILRGICWSAGEPVDRLRELAIVGARIKPGEPRNVP